MRQNLLLNNMGATKQRLPPISRRDLPEDTLLVSSVAHLQFPSYSFINNTRHHLVTGLVSQ